MKVFLKYLFALLCLVFILDRGLGYIFNKFYIHNKVRSTGGKINYYLSLPPPDLLVMGSSRSLAIIPDSFKVSCFNLGHEGMDDVFQTGLLDIIIRSNKIPKTILLHVDPEIYYAKDTDTYSRGIENLKYYYGKDSLVTVYINEISFHERFFFLFHLYRYNGRAFNLIKNAITNPEYIERNKGYEPINPTPDDSINTITMARIMPDDGPFKLSRLKYLFRFIDLCKSNHIQLILFTSPQYANRFKDASEFDSIINYKGIPYINYLKLGLPVIENNPKMWRDPVHLNSTGAAYESSDLAKRVTVLLK
jgi:hypothetical protein